MKKMRDRRNLWLLILTVERHETKVRIEVKANKKTMYANVGFPTEAKAKRWIKMVSRDEDRCLTALYKALKGQRP